MPKLTLTLPDGSEIFADLEDAAVTIGRADGNDIVVSDPSVSSNHAEISPTDSGHQIKDLDSTNGTSVNGRSVTEAKLSEGDALMIGHVPAQYGERTAPATAESEEDSEGSGGDGKGLSAEEIAAAWDDDDGNSGAAAPSAAALVAGADFGEKEKESDASGALLIVLGILALLACLLAAGLVFVKM